MLSSYSAPAGLIPDRVPAFHAGKEKLSGEAWNKSSLTKCDNACRAVMDVG